jgi:hypothetical protein
MQAAAGCLALDQSLLDQLLWKYSSAEEGQVATINAGSFVFDCLMAGRFGGLLFRELEREGWIIVVKLLRAHGGCLGVRRL